MKKNKLLIAFASLSLLFGVGLAACGGGSQEGGEEEGQQSAEPAKQETIKVVAEGSKNKLILGESVQVTAKVGDKVLDGVTWSSTDTSIATVSATGLVESKAVGSTQIKAVKDGYKEGTLKITVDLEKIVVSAADNKTSVEMDQTLQLSASIASGPLAGVAWSSSNEDVATVDPTSGLVTGVYAGSVTISATKEGYNKGSLSLTVTRPAPTGKLHWEDADHYSADGWWGDDVAGRLPIYARSSGNASDSECIAHFGAGDKETLSFTSTAAISAELVMTMASSNAIADMGAVMSVKLNEVAIDLTGKAFEGGSSSEFAEFSLGTQAILADNTVEIEFKEASAYPYLDDLVFYSKATATIALKDVTPREEIEVAAATINLNRGETAYINITNPTDTTGIVYASDNDEMASVDASGKITGEALGTANIFVKKAGLIGAVVQVTITDQPIEGEIRVEAEDQPDNFDWESLGFHMYPDGSYIAFGHSGGAYITGYDVNSEVELTYSVKSEIAQTMTLVIAAAPHYNMKAGDEFLFASDTTILLNGSEVTVNPDAKVIGDGARMGAKTQNVLIGDVSLLAKDDNEFTIQFHGKAPALDCFKFLPKVS